MAGDTYNEASPRAVFTVTANNGQYLTLDVKDVAGTGKNPTGDNEGGGADELDATPIYYSVNGGASWTLYNGTAFQAGNVPVLVAVDITPERDGTFEGEEQLQLVVNTGLSTEKSAFSSIMDDGTGKITDPIDQTTTNPTAPRSGPGAGFDDDRTLAVTAFGPVNEASTYAMFTVTGNPGYSLDLSLEGTAAVGDKEADHSGFTLIEYSTDGNTWSPYGPSNKPTVPGAGTVYVRVTITSELDASPEGAEGFALKAAYTTNTAKNATGENSIVDDGKGKKFGPNMPGGTPQESTTGLDDDTPKPPPEPVAPPSKAETPPAAKVGGVETPVERAPQTFTSALGAPDDAARMQLSTGMPILDVGERLTSRSGFPVVVDSNRPPGLQVFKGVTDQFVEGTSVAKVSMPADAFVHSKSDAVIELVATQADGSALPPWIRFDARIGGFEVEGAPDGFKGKVDIKVVARDGEGGEATVLFRIFVGDKPANDKPSDRPQGRESLSEKLRLAAKRPVLDLILIAEPEQPQEPAVAVSEAPAPAAAPVN